MRTRFHIIWLAADDVDRARNEIAEGLGAWSQQGFHLAHFNGLQGFCQASLYEGEFEDAWGLWTAERDRLRKSGLLEVQVIRIEADFLEGRLALATADSEKTSRRLQQAEKAMLRLDKEGADYSQAMARLLDAALALRQGDAPRVVRRLRSATERFEKLEMMLFAAVARRRLGEIYGGQEGAVEIAKADGWMREQAIKRPDLIAQLYLPGFKI